MQRILRPDIEYALHSVFDKVPDYASVFGKDPRAAYTALVAATLLSGIGWMQLPKPTGLRFFVASQFICTSLLTFMGIVDIKQDLVSVIATISTLIGLLATLITSPKGVQYPAEVAYWTSIFSWNLIVVLPGLSEPQKGLAGILFFMVLMVCLAVAVTSKLDGNKEGTQPIMSTMTAARIIFINNTLMIASRLL